VRYLWVLVPILALAADGIAYPVVLEVPKSDSGASLRELLTKPAKMIGTLHGHDLTLSIGRLSDPAYLKDTERERKILAISVVRLDEQTLGGVLLSYARTTIARSPAQARAFEGALTRVARDRVGV